MIPARDTEEFDLLPAADLKFVHDWLAWTDTNLEYIRNTVPIASLGPPTVGSVDGTAAMFKDEGFIFLFNPGFVVAAANFTVDEAIGISNASKADAWIVTELYPSPAPYHISSWRHGSTVSVPVGGSSCRVLQLTKMVASQDTILVTGGAGLAVRAPPGVSITESFGVSGTASVLSLSGSVLTEPSSVQVNGNLCSGLLSKNSGTVAVQFAGSAVQHGMPISSRAIPSQPWAGGWLNTTFVIPSAIKAQLNARAQAYPIAWTQEDAPATWLIPTRLLMYFFIVKPDQNTRLQLLVDGEQVTLAQSHNSRGLPHPRTFLGFYFDATNLTVDSTHNLSIEVPSGINFQGVFWENVQTEWSSNVTTCVAS